MDSGMASGRAKDALQRHDWQWRQRHLYPTANAWHTRWRGRRPIWPGHSTRPVSQRPSPPRRQEDHEGLDMDWRGRGGIADNHGRGQPVARRAQAGHQGERDQRHRERAHQQHARQRRPLQDFRHGHAQGLCHANGQRRHRQHAAIPQLPLLVDHDHRPARL